MTSQLSGGVTTAELAEFAARLAAGPAAVTDVENIDRLRLLEDLKAVCAAAQVRETVALEANRRDAEASRGIPANRRGHGLGDEVALARRESPWAGARWLGAARTLTADLPQTLTALMRGVISEPRAVTVVRETAHLTAEQRREVDSRLASRLGQLGDRELTRVTRSHAQAVDPRSATERARAAEKDRYVSLFPASEHMVHLTALLPTVQGIAVRDSLHQAATTLISTGTNGGRTRAQLTADLLVERLTGQETAQAVPVEIHLVMTDSTLMGALSAAGSTAEPANRSAGPTGVPAPPGATGLAVEHPTAPVADPAEASPWAVGFGPIPAQIARDLLDPARDGPSGKARVWLRRLYTHPESGQLVAMDSRRRLFSGLLRRMIILRDDTCRTPWCDAPIRDADHATPHASGGDTSYTNASGLCDHCNDTKEEPGWLHTADPARLDVTTPTGHTYRRDTPPLLRGLPRAGGVPSRPRTAEGPGPEQRHAGSGVERHLARIVDLHYPRAS